MAPEKQSLPLSLPFERSAPMRSFGSSSTSEMGRHVEIWLSSTPSTYNDWVWRPSYVRHTFVQSCGCTSPFEIMGSSSPRSAHRRQLASSRATYSDMPASSDKSPFANTVYASWPSNGSSLIQAWME